jgi:hypothetical protein
MLPLLSDELLLDAYRHAIRLKLDREFVQMLMAEIRRRRLHLPDESASAAVGSPVA